MNQKIGFYISSVLLALVVISSTLFVVDQRQFGVVYAFGQIQNVITEPGLNIKLPPPFQNVTYLDKRLLTLDNADTEPMLTAEKQRVVIDWYVRWRITDPLQYIRNVGIDEGAGAPIRRLHASQHQLICRGESAFTRGEMRRMMERGDHGPGDQPDALGALAGGAQEHLGRGGVRVLLEEVVLDLPDVVDAEPRRHRTR